MGRCKECAAWQMGACRNLDYCLEERTALMEEASRLATERGHVLTAFERLADGYSIFEAHCERCGCSVCVDMNPADSEQELYGNAVTTDCYGLEVPASGVVTASNDL